MFSSICRPVRYLSDAPDTKMQRRMLRPDRSGTSAFIRTAGTTPPVGWQIVTAKAKPGGISWIRDNSCEIRLLTNEREKQTICLYARPGFIGGSLLFSRDNVREQALILEKQPPNRYFLSELKGDYTGGTACRIYPGRGDDSGNCRLIIPQNMDFSSLIVEEG
ncbi:hypothetical protein [Caproicibacter fermentans]|uniref:Uncharacterized protein n=1 Tax=Caproicibacter fermentans TaxID=2576756 RepID=A0A7G8TA18_9FIRM|nr:hypothetical protein [Caproicibacter fermentans]QNK40459.1 hypothetical protein HCR03_17725 [Caproicibacter fermentans]